MQQIYKKTPMLKCDFNKVANIEIVLWHGCSLVNLLHIFRTFFPKNISDGLLLVSPWQSNCAFNGINYYLPLISRAGMNLCSMKHLNLKHFGLSNLFFLYMGFRNTLLFLNILFLFLLFWCQYYHAQNQLSWAIKYINYVLCHCVSNYSINLRIDQSFTRKLFHNILNVF